MPARTTAWTSAARAGSHPGCRAPVQRAVALALRWTLCRHPGWLPALRFVSGGLRPASLTCTPTSFFAWARTGARTAPEQGRPLQRCGNPPGGGCAFASAPAPAGAARCPAAAAPTHPPALPREGSESPSAVSGACHFVRMHRPRRASNGTPPRQGRALRVACGQPGLGSTPELSEPQRSASAVLSNDATATAARRTIEDIQQFRTSTSPAEHRSNPQLPTQQVPGLH